MGTSKKDYNLVGVNKDHPHAYGDKNLSKIILGVRLGSSPRVWGQAYHLLRRLLRVRIIPTRMGTRGKHGIPERLYEDHPHAYGDKIIDVLTEHLDEGSSPRVWGQVGIIAGVNGCNGIIPTRMGTRWRKSASAVCTWDHPHAYGDKDKQMEKVFFDHGSSPRVWGQVK